MRVVLRCVFALCVLFAIGPASARTQRPESSTNFVTMAGWDSYGWHRHKHRAHRHARRHRSRSEQQWWAWCSGGWCGEDSWYRESRRSWSRPARRARHARARPRRVHRAAPRREAPARQAVRVRKGRKVPPVRGAPSVRRAPPGRAAPPARKVPPGRKVPPARKVRAGKPVRLDRRGRKGLPVRKARRDLRVRPRPRQPRRAQCCRAFVASPIPARPITTAP